MSPNDELPLRCEVRDGAIDMSVGVAVLRFAAENHPTFWDGKSGADTPNIKITNLEVFVADVVDAINREAEDGSTLLTRMLDEAIEWAVEQGSEGVAE